MSSLHVATVQRPTRLLLAKAAKFEQTKGFKCYGCRRQGDIFHSANIVSREPKLDLLGAHLSYLCILATYMMVSLDRVFIEHGAVPLIVHLLSSSSDDVREQVPTTSYYFFLLDRAAISEFGHHMPLYVFIITSCPSSTSYRAGLIYCS
ncbi:uncharacterized protein LOC126782966 isoform X1 [Argentina anserina]|uniref:uncharacterized protein LOC126782966 isoform X1 n=1 Tax=Argentina anserina TaxID=57926 RepID=UPI0021767726|nr:uncharacterized protein LOC126782966 isoform X1 [Potentilla anserina]